MRWAATVLAIVMFVTPAVSLAQTSAAPITALDLQLSPLPPCTVAPRSRDIRAATDIAAFRASAVEDLTRKLIDYHDLAGSLRAAPGNVRVNAGVVVQGRAFLLAPVTYAAMGRLRADLVGAPAFGQRFVVFAAGTEVWRRRSVLFTDCRVDPMVFWCGRRTPPNDTNRPNLQCFYERTPNAPSWQITSGVGQPNGPAFYPAFAVKLIQVADHAEPQIEPLASINAPTMELGYRFGGWRDGRPIVEAVVISQGVAAGVWDAVDIRPSPRGFIVQAWGGEVLLSGDPDSDRANVEILTPVGPFSPEAVHRLLREKAQLHVDAAIQMAAQPN